MSLSGSIEDLPLLEILQVVSFCQKTGYLTVHAPEGDAGVVFREGRVVSGYTWDHPPASGEPERSPAAVRTRIGSVLEQLVRLREGEFAFNLSADVPTSVAGRDLTAETLADGINPEEMMLNLARTMDEHRRDSAASLQASFAADDSYGSSGPEAGPAVEDLPPAPPAAPARHGPLVLLVDDEPDVCRVVGKRLSDAGFEIALAAGAGHARREMHRLSSEGQPFLLVLDVGLPSQSGSSFRGGLDVVRHASELALPPPVLLMTETMDERLRARAKRLGVSLVAFKPGLSKLDPLQYEADLRAFADKLAKDLLPRLEGRRGRPRQGAVGVQSPASDAATAAATLEAALAEIEAGPDPDLVAFVLLRAARAFFPRVILFVVKDDRLHGLSGFGPLAGGGSLDLRAREVVVSLEEASPFTEAIVEGRPWTGPVPEGGPMRALLDGIGPLGAKTAAVVPLRAMRDAIGVLYADAPGGGDLPPLEPFAAFVERAGRALDAALAARHAAQDAAW